MKTLALTLTAALAAFVAALLPATVAAHGGDPQDTAKAMAMSMKHPMTMKGGGAITIVHMQKGCHVWSRGSGSSPGAKVFLKRGQKLKIVNHDVDAHRFVRVSGPKIALGKTLMLNQSKTLRFTKKGVYKLRTRTVEVPGAPEIETIGPDKVLVLLVVVR